MFPGSPLLIITTESFSVSHSNFLYPNSSASSSLYIAMIGVEAAASQTSGPSLRSHSLKTLNLSHCHACNKDPTPLSLQTLDSLWRLLLLCPNCILALHSSQICSYCFNQISPLDSTLLRCLSCARRVHRHCLPARNDFSSFTCVDCWVPPTLSNRKISPKFRVLVLGNPKGGNSLETVVEDAKSKAGKAVEAASRARKKAVHKAWKARCAAEFAQGAVDTAANFGAREKNTNTKNFNNCCGENHAGDFSDKDLALRLHRVINRSPRVFKGSGVMDFVDLEKQHCEIEEPSCKDDGIVEKVMEQHCEIGESSCKDDKLGTLLKEEQGSCSVKVINLSEDDKSLDSVSDPNQKIVDLETMVSSNYARSLFGHGDDGDSSALQNGRFHVTDQCLRKYSRRKNVTVDGGLYGDIFSETVPLKHYSRKFMVKEQQQQQRRTNSDVFERVYIRKCSRKSVFEEYTSECRVPAPELSGCKRSCIKGARTNSDVSSQSSPFPLSASVCASWSVTHQS